MLYIWLILGTFQTDFQRNFLESSSKLSFKDFISTFYSSLKCDQPVWRLFLRILNSFIITNSFLWNSFWLLIPIEVIIQHFYYFRQLRSPYPRLEQKYFSVWCNHFLLVNSILCKNTQSFPTSCLRAQRSIKRGSSGKKTDEREPVRRCDNTGTNQQHSARWLFYASWLSQCLQKVSYFVLKKWRSQVEEDVSSTKNCSSTLTKMLLKCKTRVQKTDIFVLLMFNYWVEFCKRNTILRMMMVFRGKKIIYLFNELFKKAILFVEAIIWGHFITWPS